MSKNGMMPGETPYTKAEKAKLSGLITDACAGDQGEAMDPGPVKKDLVFAVPGSHSIIDTATVEGRGSWSGETLEEIRKRYPGAELVEWATWVEIKAQSQNSPITWAEVTEERYFEMLEVLPPAAMQGAWFLLGEPFDHDVRTGYPRYDAFKREGGKYFASSRPMTAKQFLSIVEEAKNGK